MNEPRSFGVWIDEYQKHLGECKNPVRAAYGWTFCEDAQREADRYTAEYGSTTRVVVLSPTKEGI